MEDQTCKRRDPIPIKRIDDSFQGMNDGVALGAQGVAALWLTSSQVLGGKCAAVQWKHIGSCVGDSSRDVVAIQ